MLTMIGLARTQPISSPCRPVSSEPNSSPMTRPKPKPSQFEARINTIAVTPTVAPSANDIMLPLIVMSVMPIATQPMNDTVVSSERMLGPARKPGVAKMTASRTMMPMVCAQENTRARSKRTRGGSAAIAAANSAPPVERSVMRSPAWDG